MIYSSLKSFIKEVCHSVSWSPQKEKEFLDFVETYNKKEYIYF